MQPIGAISPNNCPKRIVRSNLSLTESVWLRWCLQFGPGVRGGWGGPSITKLIKTDFVTLLVHFHCTTFEEKKKTTFVSVFVERVFQVALSDLLRGDCERAPRRDATRANSLPRHDLQNSTYFLSLTVWGTKNKWKF